MVGGGTPALSAKASSMPQDRHSEKLELAEPSAARGRPPGSLARRWPSEDFEDTPAMAFGVGDAEPPHQEDVTDEGPRRPMYS
mmetsp:Transcript_48741/g.109426  ORF Transcript_48741/g.109426 Transcript_48741/m.109426 type:complete len:83 (+) Transcript_48741:543-791(+)